MANATISYGPKLGLINNAAIGEVYYDQFRPFLRGMDALVQANVLDILATPPLFPSNGDAYLVSPGATGLWRGQDNKLAVYSTQITLTGTNTLTSGWEFYTPQPGWTVYCVIDALYYYFNVVGAWVSELATASVAGVVMPDGITTTVNGTGVISAVPQLVGIGVTSVTCLQPVDGNNTFFTFNAAASPTPAISVFAGGVYQIPGGDFGISYSGSNVWTIAFFIAPTNGPVGVLIYETVSSTLAQIFPSLYQVNLGSTVVNANSQVGVSVGTADAADLNSTAIVTWQGTGSVPSIAATVAPLILNAYINSSGQVYVTIYNPTGGSITIPGGAVLNVQVLTP